MAAFLRCLNMGKGGFIATPEGPKGEGWRQFVALLKEVVSVSFNFSVKNRAPLRASPLIALIPKIATFIALNPKIATFIALIPKIATFIALIPNIVGAYELKNFCPTSWVGGIDKIISKALANHRVW